MDEQTVFAVRVAGALASVVIAFFSGRELIRKFSTHKFNAAFWLILPFTQLSMGTACALAWAATSTALRLVGHDVDWMRVSWFIPFYTGFMFTAAAELIYALTWSIYQAVIVSVFIIVVSMGSYLWMGNLINP